MAKLAGDTVGDPGPIAIRRLADVRWTLTGLPAIWHNTPEKIAGVVGAKLARAQGQFDAVFVAYGDCGTGGALDAVVAAARDGAVTEPMKGLSLSRRWARTMSKRRLLTGRLTGSQTVPPHWCSTRCK